ncbi:poly(R)-hydroxyalkanoic acid synthase subunit PhaE [Desulfoferrobacter suflitae]|uniref:poly(R)-hydroxyalkanoic acid synthase subunit PhaE n=1 Tax=Desulfoferrobacter suflitae TaxID=2865782 RepID=UPI0021643588|nr:poly(R)-hydroxyalkanoic acid synthase subunit PhaE [Desulfoferrobacter suflitae]MCK8601557.1 hypothetical protein [Desulfoferrobacter suflitae]
MTVKDNEWSWPSSLLNAWTQATADFWATASQEWSAGFPGLSGNFGPAAGDAQSRTQEQWQAALKMWQTISSSFSSPEATEALLKGMQTWPEISSKLIRTIWEGYSHLHQHWLRKLGRLGETTEAYKFENLDQEIFKTWQELYQKEIQPYLQAPQLGLTRFYQERANDAVDKFHLYQAAVGEFIHMLHLPMEKSVRVVYEKIEELAKEGQLSEDFKEYYNIWIKVLEGHYMTLFKSPDYLQCLAQTLNAANEFKMARHRLLIDMLQPLPLPTNREMDELYKELYLLKKRVRELEQNTGEKG